MSRLPTIHINRRSVNSPFGLLGTDENALTYALGYTFQQCPHLLQWFLKRVGVQGIKRSTLRRARIDLQRHRLGDESTGITDIEIQVPGHCHIIIEAKVGLSIPTIGQCQKYLDHFQSEPVQKLVALVQSPNDSFIQRYGKTDENLSNKLVAFSWPDLVPPCIRLQLKHDTVPGHDWVRHFYDFVDQEFRMKAFTNEVWILPTNETPLWQNGMSFWEIHEKYHLWWDFKNQTVRPLYMAFRRGGTVDSIYRIHRVDQGVPMIVYVPELKNIKEPWPQQPATIWHFGPPVPLANPLRTGAGMYNRRVRCDLDLLLTCDTVQEVEAEMGKRREVAE